MEELLNTVSFQDIIVDEDVASIVKREVALDKDGDGNGDTSSDAPAFGRTKPDGLSHIIGSQMTVADLVSFYAASLLIEMKEDFLMPFPGLKKWFVDLGMSDKLAAHSSKTRKYSE